MTGIDLLKEYLKVIETLENLEYLYLWYLPLLMGTPAHKTLVVGEPIESGANFETPSEFYRILAATQGIYSSYIYASCEFSTDHNWIEERNSEYLKRNVRRLAIYSR